MQVSCVQTTESQELFHKKYHMSIYVVKNLILCTILSFNYKGLNIGVLFVYAILQ